MNRSDENISQSGRRINSSSMRGVWVMLRGGQYCLVKESEANDKSFMVVSILKSDDHPRRGDAMFGRATSLR